MKAPRMKTGPATHVTEPALSQTRAAPTEAPPAEPLPPERLPCRLQRPLQLVVALNIILNRFGTFTDSTKDQSAGNC